MRLTRRAALATPAWTLATRPAWAVQAARSAPPEASVMLRAGMTVTEALSRCASSGGVAVVAVLPLLERKLEAASEALPLSQALETISGSCRVGLLRRPGSLAVLSQFTSPKELLDFDEAELREIGADLAQAIESIWSRPVRAGQTERILAFGQSLSGSQWRAMQGDGLPFTALSRSQQSLWLEIDYEQGLGMTALTFRRTRDLFGKWPAATLTQETHRGRTSLFLRWSGTPEEPRRALTLIFRPEQRLREPETKRFVVGLPTARPATTAGFRRRAALPAGEYPVADLLSRLSALTEETLEPPAYAARRRVWVDPGGRTAADVLQALRDALGQELAPTGAHAWRLRRPRGRAATSVEDLHRLAQAAVPPEAHFLWKFQHATATGVSPARYVECLDPVLAAILKAAGPDWTRFEVAALAPELRRRLANLAFDQLLASEFGHYLIGTEPQAHLAHPERGSFVVTGGDEKGEGRIFEFRVPTSSGRTSTGGGFGVDALGR